MSSTLLRARAAAATPAATELPHRPPGTRPAAFRRLAAMLVLSAAFGVSLAATASADPIDPPSDHGDPDGDVFVPVFAAPSHFKLFDLGNGKVRMSWRDRSVGERAFRLKRHRASGVWKGVRASELSPAGPLRSHSSATKGKKYQQRLLHFLAGQTRCYAVVAVKPGVTSRRSPEVCLSRAPRAPDHLRVATATAHNIHLAWHDNSSNEHRFEIRYWRSSDPDGYGVRYASANGDGSARYNLEVDHDDTEYCEKVRSLNKHQDASRWSNTVCVTTDETPVPGTANLGMKTDSLNQFVTCSEHVIWQLEPIILQPGVGTDEAFTVDQSFENESPYTDDGNTWSCRFTTSSELGRAPGTSGPRCPGS